MSKVLVPGVVPLSSSFWLSFPVVELQLGLGTGNFDSLYCLSTSLLTYQQTLTNSFSLFSRSAIDRILISSFFLENKFKDYSER